MAIKVPTKDLVLENRQITYRNFAGNESDFNKKGDRNFAVWIDDPQEAEAIAELGWKVKYKKPEEDGTPGRAYMPVTVKYHPRLRPPMVKILKKQGQISLDEESVELVDFMDIEKCDMVLRPFHWQHKSSGEGVKNMCSSIYITIRQDALELKYAHIPEITPGRGQLALGAGEEFDPIDATLEDMGEIAENQYALEQGRGF